jgi:hypothetical protein
MFNFSLFYFMSHKKYKESKEGSKYAAVAAAAASWGSMYELWTLPLRWRQLLVEGNGLFAFLLV